MPRTAKPQISFADWELLQQGVSLEPLLQSICDFLEDHEEMIEAVRHDLERGLKSPGAGRSGLTPQQVLRSLVLMRVKSWTYRELRERTTDGYTLRQFADFYCQPVPKHDAFIWENIWKCSRRGAKQLHIRKSATRSYWKEAYCGEGSGRFLRTGFSPEAGAGSALAGFAGSGVAGVATSSPPPSE